MKRILVALTLFSGLAVAQVQAPPPGSERPAEQSRVLSTIADRGKAPSYSDYYCAGFVTKEKFPATNEVVAALNPDISRVVERGTVFISAEGLNVGSQYSIVRMLKDPNHMELFPGQNKLLNRLGNLYADVGRVLVTRIDGNIAVARVEFTCDALIIGDTLIPFVERPRPDYRTENLPFERFLSGDRKASGRIVMGKDFDEVVGMHRKVYINLGANQGIKPGDYLRITRSYNPKDLPPVERLSLKAPFGEDTQKDPHPPKKSTGAKLPWRGLGELMIMSTTADSATAIITRSVEDIHLGDVVEAQPPQ